MKKIIISCFLVVVIGIIFSYIVLRIGFLGSEDNFFNNHWRAKFSQYLVLRQIFGLHFDGDAKMDYLGSHYKDILIEVDSMDKFRLKLSTIDFLTKQIQKITNKPVAYIFSNDNILYKESLTSKEIGEVVKMYRDYFNNKSRTTIYLLIASKDEKQPSLLGSTFQDYGIVLFADALTDFTRDSADETVVNYAVSTILHEFGHQIGLPHNSDPNCLMNERVENYSGIPQSSEEVVVDFCEFEIQFIQMQAGTY